VLVDGFRHLHEFVFAELAVFVFVELREHLGWIRRLRTAASFWTASAGGAAFAFAFAGLAGLAATASATHVAHFFARFGAFFVVQFAVFVGIEFFEHALAHFGALAIGFFAVLLWWLGDCRQGQYAGRDQCETRDEISHFRSFQNRLEKVIAANAHVESAVAASNQTTCVRVAVRPTTR
jgi:hypothetical protein